MLYQHNYHQHLRGNYKVSLLTICLQLWLPVLVSLWPQEEQVKREDAKASYEAWKQKKAGSLKAKAKEKQDMIRKEQRAIEEKEEKRESAKKVCSSFIVH